MFRALLCSSSGAQIGIVTLFKWLFSAPVKRGICTGYDARSTKC